MVQTGTCKTCGALIALTKNGEVLFDNSELHHQYHQNISDIQMDTAVLIKDIVSTLKDL